MPPNAAHCAALVRDAERDRYLAALFAPAEQRADLLALYAFAIEIARVREVAREPMPGEIRLQWWREALAGERDNETAAHPVASAVRDALARHALPLAPMIELVDAHAFDFYGDPMMTLAELEAYAAQTQGNLFALAAGMLGARGEKAAALSRHAGIAYGVAGLIRALPRHVARGQLYLPLDVLQRHGLAPATVLAGQGSEPLKAALVDLAGFARGHLAAAQEGMAAAPSAMLPAFLPAATIGPGLREMTRSDADPFAPRPLSGLRRQWLIWRAARDPRRIFRA